MELSTSALQSGRGKAFGITFLLFITTLLHSSQFAIPLEVRNKRGAFGSKTQGQRFLHHRLQSAWDVAKSNVARVPHLVAPRVRTKMSFCRKFTTVMLLGSMGVAGVSIYDDYLIFEQCSKRAMEKATTDTRLKDILGEHIQQGPWYEATMGVDHEGHSASCSFPVTGSLGSANLHLRAVRYEEKKRWWTPYMPGLAGGQWDVLVLEASMPSMLSRAHNRVNLLQPNAGPKAGDRVGGGACGPSATVGHHEV